jgi:predicted secreted protein
MERGKRLLAVCHCILNANAKVFPLARYPGAHLELVRPFLERGAGIVQLPCPETVYLGLSRFGMTREQYDVPRYRAACREMLGPVVEELSAFAAAGYVIEAVVGMDGSPSCGVFRTCLGYRGGEPAEAATDLAGQIKALRIVPGDGVFIGELRDMLTARGLAVPFAAVDEARPGGLVWE